jgi:hypothetical protein
MQKNFILNPQPDIFKAITEEAISFIENDSLCLESVFFVNRLNGPEIHLSLSNLYLAVFSPHQKHPDYRFQLELTFDIKF